MPRSSRHRSHRSHKNSSRDWSESEDEGSSKERKAREEDPARVSRDAEAEKRKSSHSSLAKDLVVASNGDLPGEHGKKRKDGGGDDLGAEKRYKGEVFGPEDVDKSSKSKLSVSESKSRSSRRQEDSTERNEESGGKDSSKRRSEKESSRRESSAQYKDEKEKDKDRERGSDRDKKSQDAKHERSEDVVSRKSSSKTDRIEDKHVPKRDVEFTEKEPQKHARRRDESEDKDKRLGDGREIDDRKHYSRDDHSKHRSYKDQGHDDEKYKDKYDKYEKYDKYDKYRDDADRDKRYRDERREDERSREYTSSKSEYRSSRDEKKSSESRYRKSKLQDEDAYESKHKDNNRRKRSSVEREDVSDFKPQGVKEPRIDVERIGSDSRSSDFHVEKAMPEYGHSEKVDSGLGENRPKSSPSSSSYHSKGQSRHNSKQMDSARKRSPSEERTRSRTVSSGERTTASRLPACDLPEILESSQYTRTPRSTTQPSPDDITTKSPSTSERRFSDYKVTPRRSLDTEIGHKSSNFKDRNREESEFLEKPISFDHSQAEARERTPAVSSFINKPTNSDNPPPPPYRRGRDEDDSRSQSGDWKSHFRQKRSDLNSGGCGNTWNNAPTWPSPVANGFIPLQHGPSPGFHPSVHPFPSPPMFNLRPPMDLTHNGVPYHMHEAVDRFSGHVRPFGWHNSMDGLFNDEPHIYNRPHWDQNRSLTWKEQNGNMEYPTAQREREYARSEHGSESLPTESIEAKNDAPLAKIAEKTLNEDKTESIPEAYEKPGDDNANFIKKYLSRINIAHDFIASELYTKCMAVLGELDVKLERDVSKDGCSQENDKANKVEMKRMTSNTLLPTLFPKRRDAIFQRAMSLYKKQNGVKAPQPATPVVSMEAEKDSPEARNEEISATADLALVDKIPSVSSLPAGNMEEPVPAILDSTESADGLGEDNGKTSDADGDHPTDMEEGKTDLITNADVLTKDSQDSEALVESTSVNLSRIPNSPESTH
ncbi:hypothetical protein ACMD2_10065 [Ananas comosus]|uniref:Uncharacterized protein n=1 Tax=Ananas comosus TaxID=4615 RepID=A0A199UWZ6_ANACO|nr:hypothetical protein ACMD2_10065 [Ananas comosus]